MTHSFSLSFEPSEETSFVTLLPTLIGYEDVKDCRFLPGEAINVALIERAWREETILDEDVDAAVRVTIPRERIAFCRSGPVQP